MLNFWTYLCGTTDQWLVDPTDPRKIYIPKQTRFNYLTYSCTITFEQSFTRTVGRFDFVWL